MFLRIRNQIERELQNYFTYIDKQCPASRFSRPLFNNIKEFICRSGKRVRPILFCIGYLGFAKKPAAGLWRSALSLELLHDFMLVHDDIIDKSVTRRGKPSMHTLLNRQLPKNKGLKFSGEDLTIIAGDVMYAMALEAFLAIKEKPRRKEAALKKLISAALYTGTGEFIELLLGAKSIEKITQKEIYKVYDFKTANYTFASPLSMGATLAGAKPAEINKLFRYGMYLGRAFQIKDDILGSFSTQKQIGKPNLSDLKEAKRTLLVWYALKKSCRKDKLLLKKIMAAKSTGYPELLKARRIIRNSGALAYAQDQIVHLQKLAQKEIYTVPLRQEFKTALENFSQEILKQEA